VTSLRTLDLRILDEALGMEGGYVLNFSDRTFSTFFAEELNIDIDDPRYAQQGSSKAKRLRFLLQKSDRATCTRVLEALWNHRQQLLAAGYWRSSAPAGADGRFLDLLQRLLEPLDAAAGATPFAFQTPAPAFGWSRIDQLRQRLIAVAALEPHARGYEFESFLTALFNAHGLNAKEPFRLRGEQIDGSFSLANEIYLVEAKWQSQPTGNDDLHTFHGKLEQKAAWTRGVFVSHAGFTAEGLYAFGRGKRVICVDGLDINDLLDRRLPLDRVLEAKVRRAAETGEPFHRVRDLFPS
jgi:hypothetical protein